MPDQTPWYLRPTQYSDEPEIPRAGATDDTPIDYSKGPDRSIVFGEEEDDGADPQEDLES